MSSETRIGMRVLDPSTLGRRFEALLRSLRLLRSAALVAVSYMLVFPLVGVLILVFVPREAADRWVLLAIMLALFALAGAASYFLLALFRLLAAGSRGAAWLVLMPVALWVSPRLGHCPLRPCGHSDRLGRRTRPDRAADSRAAPHSQAHAGSRIWDHRGGPAGVSAHPPLRPAAQGADCLSP